MPPRSITLIPVDDDPRILEAVAKLRSCCVDYDIELPDDTLALCVKHLLYVMQVNEYINLTRITNFDEALVLHILDSLVLLPTLRRRSSKAASPANQVETPSRTQGVSPCIRNISPCTRSNGVASSANLDSVASGTEVGASSPNLAASPSLHLLDMGTGAGFPGIPLAVATGSQATLLDAVGKKVAAVSAFATALNLSNVTVVHERLESYAIAQRGNFDLVVARAVAPLGILLEYARPFLHIGGSLLVTKGTPSDEELSTGSSVASKLGYQLVARQDLELPHSLGHRSIFHYEVVSKSTIKLPRQMGLAKKNPLA